jgi:hypothetical protein
MKQILFIFLVVFAFANFTHAQESSITHEVFSNYVEQKIERMQRLIGFSDSQATQLKDLELKFLIEVQKAENCCWCNRTRRIEKLKKQRDADLHKILDRDQYIKYDVVLKGRIKKIPVRVEE